MSERYFENDVYNILPDEVVEKEPVSFPKTIKKTDLLRNTAWVMMNHPTFGKNRSLWPVFKEKFYVKKNSTGDHVFMQETGEQVMAYVSSQKIIDAILNYWEKKATWVLDTKTVVTEQTAKDCFRYWAATGGSFEAEIEPVKQRDWPGYCFHHLPFNFGLTFENLTNLGQEYSEEKAVKNIKELCPAFYEMFDRITNAQAFMAWIGSLFDAKSSRQQYVWLYGEGRNGKSTLGRILAKLMGPAVRFEHPPDKGDKFWTNGLLGKRLIIFGDCNNYNYPSTGQFKALTGEDQIRVEAKGQPSYSVDLFCKFLFFSNDSPGINGGESNKRRAIYCEVGPVTKEFGKNYEAILWAETPVFIGECIRIYKETTRESRSIAIDEDGLNDLISDNEDRYEYFVQQELNIHSPEAKDLDLLTPAQLQLCFRRQEIFNHMEQRNYLAYMKRKYGIKKIQNRENDRKRVYTNCSSKIK